LPNDGSAFADTPGNPSQHPSAKKISRHCSAVTFPCARKANGTFSGHISAIPLNPVATEFAQRLRILEHQPLELSIWLGSYVPVDSANPLQSECCYRSGSPLTAQTSSAQCLTEGRGGVRCFDCRLMLASMGHSPTLFVYTSGEKSHVLASMGQQSHVLAHTKGLPIAN